MVPSDASVQEESARRELPKANAFLIGNHKEAALTLVNRQTSAIIWADSKSDSLSFTGGPRTLARRLVEQLKKDYGKDKEK